MSSIGQKLSQARMARDLTIEDVAFCTRIPAALVQHMENDDLSRFASLIYARGFLKIYSGFLDLDISGDLAQFRSTESAHTPGPKYLQGASTRHNLPTTVFAQHGRAGSPGLHVLLALLLVAGAIVWWSATRGNDNTALAENPPPLADPPANRLEKLMEPEPPVEIPDSTEPDGRPIAAGGHDFALPDPVAIPPKATVVEEEGPPTPGRQSPN